MPAGRTLILGALLGALVAARPLPAAVLADYDFTRGDAGWRDEAGSPGQRTDAGTLWPGTAAGISLRSPEVQWATAAFQAVELSAICEQPGMVHLLWYGVAFGRLTPSWQGPLPLDLPADGRPHDVRLLPFWQNVKSITGLRLVATPGTRLRLRRLRIVGPDQEPLTAPLWNLADVRQAGRWLSLGGGANLRPQTGGLQVTLAEPTATLQSPPLQVPTYQYEWLSADVTASSLQTVRPQWATSGQRGLHGRSLPGRAGRHSYNVRASDDRSWMDMARGVALELGGQPGASAVVHSLGLYDRPQGAPDLQTLYAGPVEDQPRAGRSFRLAWVLQNCGGQPARDVQVRVQAGEATFSGRPATSTIARMDFQVPEILVWDVLARGPVTVTLEAQYGGQTLRETVAVPVTPALPITPWRRVTPPRVEGASGIPVFSLYRTPPPVPLGVEALDRRLYARPYLGDYEPSPEVFDWQIKWAREYGLQGWIFDISDVGAAADRATLDAFFGATYGRQMQFCLRWTSPTPTVGEGQQLFGRELAPLLAQPNYLRLGGKPVILVANPLVRGNEGLGLSDLRDLSTSTGLVFIACLPGATVTADLLQRAGYAACVDLHTDPGLPREASPVQDWEAATTAGLNQVQCLQPAWSRDLTPERLGTLLRIARLRAARADTRTFPLVILGDWNGPDGVEPRRPYGFAYLEALRQAVGTPAASRVVPEDVGLGPYDRPLPAGPSEWEFDSKETWTSAMGLSVLRVANGQLTARTDTDSPAIFGGDTLLDARRFDTVAVGLAASAGTRGRLWWRTSLRKFTLDHSLSFDLIADGAIHEYRLPVGAAAGWEGYVQGLRLDPTDAPGASIIVDYIRVLPRAEAAPGP